MPLPLDPHQEQSLARDCLSEARTSLRAAEDHLRHVQQLLDATGRVAWGQLTPPEARERRLLLFTAHKAWASIDKGIKTILRGPPSPVRPEYLPHDDRDEHGMNAEEREAHAAWEILVDGPAAGGVTGQHGKDQTGDDQAV